MSWSEVQRMAAKALFHIRVELYPKCEGCGYSADRQKCAHDLGGGCGRHEQEDVLAIERVMDLIKKEGGLEREPFDKRWDLHMPLFQLHGIPPKEQHDLLPDLEEAGGRLTSRTHDDRYRWLANRQACYYSAQGDRWYVTLADRGREWLAELKVQL